MAMIERGADPQLFARKRGRLGHKLGLVGIGFALGILIGNILFTYTTMVPEVCFFSMIFLFTGLALVVDHYLAKQEAEKQEALKERV